MKRTHGQKRTEYVWKGVQESRETKEKHTLEQSIRK